MSWTGTQAGLRPPELRTACPVRKHQGQGGCQQLTCPPGPAGSPHGSPHLSSASPRLNPHLTGRNTETTCGNLTSNGPWAMSALTLPARPQHHGCTTRPPSHLYHCCPRACLPLCSETPGGRPAAQPSPSGPSKPLGALRGPWPSQALRRAPVP